MLSNYKDVVHILPVKRLEGRLEGTIVHEIVKQIITNLENIGFEVQCVICDNHSVNRKAMSLFCDNRELFFIIDSVHILKNIRNNWINKEPQHMICPPFKDEDCESKIASFETLKELYRIEKDSLLKYGYSLSLKALYPLFGA
jgi:hypothetical protein